MQSDKLRGFRQTDEPVHLQAELPTEGTPLNPLEDEWIFSAEDTFDPADLRGE